MLQLRGRVPAQRELGIGRLVTSEERQTTLPNSADLPLLESSTSIGKSLKWGQAEIQEFWEIGSSDGPH